MKHLCRPILMLIALGMALSVATPVPAQSLADLARKNRAQREQEPKTGRVFTNDSIPTPTISSAPAAETAPSAKPQNAESQNKDAAAAETPAKSDEPTQAELEKEYRDKFAALKENLDTETRRLDVLQRELNLAQQQFYSDPNVALREQYNREEINKRMADIETQKATVEKAKQAIADLEDELRTKNLPPGWAR